MTFLFNNNKSSNSKSILSFIKDKIKLDNAYKVNVNSDIALSITDESISFLSYKASTICNYNYIKIGSEQKQILLNNLVRSLSLYSKKVNLVLTPEQYQIITTDKLIVVESELEEALKWSIQDKVDYSVDDMVLEYIDPTINCKDLTNKKVVVIATSKKLIKDLYNLSCKAGLILNTITTSDINSVDILRFFLNKTNIDSEKDIILYFYRLNNHNNIMIYYKNSILLIRRLPIIYDNTNYQELSIELKRSVTYCRSNLSYKGNINIVMFSDIDINKIENLIEEKVLNIELENLIKTEINLDSSNKFKIQPLLTDII